MSIAIAEPAAATAIGLPPSEAAKLLFGATTKNGERRLQDWRGAGTGPRYVKIGRSVFYPVAELEKFIASRLRASTRDHAELAA